MQGIFVKSLFMQSPTLQSNFVLIESRVEYLYITSGLEGIATWEGADSSSMRSRTW